MATRRVHSFTKTLGALRSTIAGPRDPLIQCLAPRLSRSMATETTLPRDANRSRDLIKQNAASPATPAVSELIPTTVQTTIYHFPSMEPLRFESYSAKHLHMPLRRDLLHRAVVFEGDFTRQGTASTKTRWEIHGSHRKIRPQKGTGKSRLGTRQSPMLKGGSKVFGPRPRDFATALPRKIYDIAWRTALSYRYRKGELVVCENGAEIEKGTGGYIKTILEHHGWGKGNGRTLFVTAAYRRHLDQALKEDSEYGKVLTMDDVDVKDLLEGTDRVVIEKKALDEVLAMHQSDLVGKMRS
ncbi:50S ribosomal protein-like protein L4 [Calycina marina]|uniref:Large ribosomal subunit protein uL4m n=1 Tax=Calycina marina TaxID=1763456 RepID=A0A9P7ZBH2_9HELO|nr:50S ribosomal protein-like protein L4 [Calycina marina]